MTPSVDEVINNTPIAYDTSDLAMVSAMIECEAANQPGGRKLAVGSVIVNRVNSPKFDSTINRALRPFPVPATVTRVDVFAIVACQRC